MVIKINQFNISNARITLKNTVMIALSIFTNPFRLDEQMRLNINKKFKTFDNKLHNIKIKRTD
jgi:hypothetical protein